MNTKIRIVLILMALCMLWAASACGFKATPAVSAGDFGCTILISLPGAITDIVILSFTITPDQKIGDWSIFDFGTRSVSFGNGFGQSSLNGNVIQFTLTDSSNGRYITYKINGTIESVHKMTGDYSFDYGSSYGVAADKFECDLTPPTAQSTPTTVPVSQTPMGFTPISPSTNEPARIEVTPVPTSTNKPSSIQPTFTSSVPATTDSPIYTDALTGAWQDWSWDSTRSFANAKPVHSGSASIAVTIKAAWGGLLLHTDTAVPTTGYTAIQFWVHGGSIGGQSLKFHVTDAGPAYPFTVPANTWLQITVPLTAIGNPTTLSALFWQDNSGSVQPTFYLDDISLTK
jgi:hypothetical protein